MEEKQLKHDHKENDVIIKDQDGIYKILKEGHFVPLDEDEAKEHGVNLSEQEQKKPAASSDAVRDFSGLADSDLRQKAEMQIKKSGITFSSSVLKDRAVTTLVSHYKGVRKPFETKEVLKKDPLQGGVGLDDDEVERMMQASDQTEERSPQIDVQKTKKPENTIVKPIPEAKPVGQEVQPPPKIDVKNPPPLPKPPAPPKPVAIPKPKVSDVQKPAMPTVGLAGELAYSLADWRRLTNNPQDRIKKIENQLGVLEEDEYTQRIKGIQAWRNSEVVHLYLNAGKQSLKTGKTVSEILSQGGADQLSYEEWKAVAALNERIRY